MGAKSQRDVAAVYPAPSLILGWGGVGKAENAGVKKTEFLMRALNEQKEKTEFGFLLLRKSSKLQKYYFSDKKWGMQKNTYFGGAKKTIVFGGNLFFDGTV